MSGAFVFDSFIFLGIESKHFIFLFRYLLVMHMQAFIINLITLIVSKTNLVFKRIKFSALFHAAGFLSPESLKISKTTKASTTSERLGTEQR